MSWDIVIGLEVHAQLKTQSKIFSAAATAYGAPANTQACAVDLGLPGVLPVFNAEALTLAIRFGLAIGASIPEYSVFARKNYFYPDLPKGYQISQLDQPIVQGGQLQITLDDGQQKVIPLTRAHLEEDAGKSLHTDFSNHSGIDLNRAGTPLLEIVSEPALSSAKEAVAYLKALHTLVTYLEICDGNMAEGSFRCDANVSLKPSGSERLGTRTELKNINSFRFVEKAINYEVERQMDILESGGSILQETRLYDADKDETRSMRSKEEANDYRYFPDPDLLPIHVSQDLITEVQASLPELPEAKQQRFANDYGLSDYDSQQLTSERATADYFEQVVAQCQDAKLAANWVMGELSKALNQANTAINASPVTAPALGLLLQRIKDNTISGKIAKEVFNAMWAGEGSADAIIDAKGLKQVTDTGALQQLVDQVLADNPDQVAGYRGGKTKLMGFFVGQIMKASQGKANPAQVNQLLKARLDS